VAPTAVGAASRRFPRRSGVSPLPTEVARPNTVSRSGETPLLPGRERLRKISTFICGPMSHVKKIFRNGGILACGFFGDAAVGRGWLRVEFLALMLGAVWRSCRAWGSRGVLRDHRRAFLAYDGRRATVHRPDHHGLRRAAGDPDDRVVHTGRPGPDAACLRNRYLRLARLVGLSGATPDVARAAGRADVGGALGAGPLRRTSSAGRCAERADPIDSQSRQSLPVLVRAAWPIRSRRQGKRIAGLNGFWPATLSF
jgi:hypothetical protein